MESLISCSRRKSTVGSPLGCPVIAAHIVDYGVVSWQYRVPGLILSMMAETLVAGTASGWNPLIMGAVAGSELFTDVPFWWGGAYIAGLALRPVQVWVEALWVAGCEQDVWQEEALVMLVPWKTLANISPEERRRKEVQLTVNLARAFTEIAENAGHELRLTPCDHQATTNGVAPAGRSMNLNQELVK